MSSLASLVASGGSIHSGDPDGADVLALQIALSAAGYRVGQDGQFGPRTEMVVRQFQLQHGLKADGIVGAITAALLDAPHEVLVKTAIPLTNVTLALPHDDTASLIAFYGDPRGDLDKWKNVNVVTVKCPWTLRYEGALWPHEIPLHRRCAPAFANAFEKIWVAARRDDSSDVLRHLHNYSGSGNLRPVRGSSRISTHGFWAAIDFDAEHLPLGHHLDPAEMPQAVVDAFESEKLFWGGRFIGRPDAMHIQAAHE